MKTKQFFSYLLSLAMVICLLSILFLSVSAEDMPVFEISGVPTDPAVGDTVAVGDASVPENANYRVTWEWYKYIDGNNMGLSAPFEGTLEKGSCYFLEFTVYVNADWEGWTSADEDGTVYAGISINGDENYCITSITPVEDASYTGKGTSYYMDYDFTEKLDAVAITGIPEVTAGSTATVESILPEAQKARYTVTEAHWSHYNTETGLYDDFTGGTFVDGGVYQLYISVQGKPGYGFSDDTTLTVNGEVSEDFYTSSNTMFIYLDYDLSKKITEAYITGVTAPVAGEMATTDGIAVPEDALYSVSGVWYAMDSETGEYDVFAGAFEEHGSYYLELTLTAADGYTFDDENVIYVDGEEQFSFNYHNEAGVTLEFDLLDAISSVELTGTDQVIIGAQASTNGLSVPEDAPYTATAYWLESTLEESETFEGVFEEGHIYYYCVELEPTAGNKFAEDAVVSYNGQVLDVAASGLVSEDYIFIIAQTYTGDLQPIDSISLYTEIAPGLTPEDVTVSLPDDALYTLTEISWTDVEVFEELTGPFEEGKEYLLTACIIPTEGYYIAEVLQCLVNDQPDVGEASGAHAYGYVFVSLICAEPEETTEPITEAPTEEPTEATTEEPTEATTQEPTEATTQEPTEATTEEPTEATTEEPTEATTEESTEATTEEPTEAPTEAPTKAPIEEPTAPSAEDSVESIPSDSGSGSSSSNAADSAPPVTPPTGDNTMLLLLIVLAVISATAVIILLTRKKVNK